MVLSEEIILTKHTYFGYVGIGELSMLFIKRRWKVPCVSLLYPCKHNVSKSASFQPYNMIVKYK